VDFLYATVMLQHRVASVDRDFLLENQRWRALYTSEPPFACLKNGFIGIVSKRL
jgi:hypothetical protein